MKILVTGGSGLLGNKITEIALEKYEIYAGYCHNKPEIGEPIKFNLTTDAGLETIYKIRPEVIIHTAALTNVDNCEINKELAYKINVKGTKKIADIAKELNIFFLYVSSDYVFSGIKGMYKEEDTPNPINYYGYTKLLGEWHCDCIVRPSVIYGSKPASGKVNFVLWLINKLMNKQKVKIAEDQFTTPTFNTNLARMILEIAKKKLKGIFHLSGATRISRYDFALKIANKFGLDKDLIVPSKIDEMEWIAKRPKDSSLDITKASTCLKEKPCDLNAALDILEKEINKNA